jgi:hypothetical protein
MVSGFFGHLYGRFFVLNRCGDYRSAQCFKFVFLRFVGGQLSPAVRSPVSAIKEQSHVSSGHLFWQCQRPAIDQIKGDLRKLVALY